MWRGHISHALTEPRRGALVASRRAHPRPHNAQSSSVNDQCPFPHVQQPPSPCGPCRELPVTRAGSAGTFFTVRDLTVTLRALSLDDFHDNRTFSFTPPVLIYDYSVCFVCWLKVFQADPQQKRCNIGAAKGMGRSFPKTKETKAEGALQTSFH